MDLETIRTLHRLNQLALVVIDAQKNFSHTKIGTDASTGIIEAKQTLSELNLLSFIVFMDHMNEGYENACGGLLDGLLQTNDPPPISKQSSDAFLDKKLGSALSKHGIKGVLLSGNNADGCILTSMRSMSGHFQIAGISTAIGSAYQGQESIFRTFNLMKHEGFGIHSLQQIKNSLSL